MNEGVSFEDIRFDAMLVAPGRLPRHIPAAFDASR
jgi:Holliday junction resolvase-like predicted endonuclease